jgi:hypothetical protein
LDPIDRTFLAQAGGACREAVEASHLLRAGTCRRVIGFLLVVRVVTHRLVDFVGSIERLAWAKASGCPWVARTCALVARGGHLEVLRWVRENNCPWDTMTSAWAACRGHLEVLRWAREHDCPWDATTCRGAARTGHLEVLQWAREHGCPWNKQDCEAVAWQQLETLAWVRAQPQ